jgi:hypothetical protein
MEIKGDRKPWYKRRWAIVLEVVAGIFILLAIIPVGGDDSTLAMQAGSIKANNNLSASTSTSSSEFALFSAKRIAVLNLSGHPMMRGLSKKLAERLEQVPAVEQVDLFQAEAWPEDGTRLYDQYILLDLPEFSTWGLLATGRRVKANVKASVGRGFWNSRHSYSDHLSPPLVQISSELKLNHESTGFGYETANTKYAQVVENIAQQFGESITKSITEWSGKYASPDVLPQEFYPEYRATPVDLPLPINPDLQKMVSGSGFMLNNYTVWTMQTHEALEELKTLHQALVGGRTHGR